MNMEQEQSPQEHEEKQILGTLFENINYYSVSDLDNFINNLTKEQSQYCMNVAIEYAIKKGIFNIVETEIISKSIRKLSLDN